MEEKIDIKRGLKLIASMNHWGVVFYGFDTIVQIHKRLPMLWIFIPITFLLKWSGIGCIWYEKLSSKRIIFHNCQNDSCDQAQIKM